jgi:hypothetical protein
VRATESSSQRTAAALGSTPDGAIWAPGDSRLIPDHHLRMPTADAMLFDFSDSEWHFGLEGAIATGHNGRA